MGTPLPEFGRILKGVFRWMKTISLGFIVLMAVLLAFRVADVFRAAHELNPALGWAFLVALGLGLWLLVGRPLARFLPGSCLYTRNAVTVITNCCSFKHLDEQSFGPAARPLIGARKKSAGIGTRCRRSGRRNSLLICT